MESVGRVAVERARLHGHSLDRAIGLLCQVKCLQHSEACTHMIKNRVRYLMLPTFTVSMHCGWSKVESGKSSYLAM